MSKRGGVEKAIQDEAAIEEQFHRAHSSSYNDPTMRGVGLGFGHSGGRCAHAEGDEREMRGR